MVTEAASVIAKAPWEVSKAESVVAEAVIAEVLVTEAVVGKAVDGEAVDGEVVVPDKVVAKAVVAEAVVAEAQIPLQAQNCSCHSTLWRKPTDGVRSKAEALTVEDELAGAG